MEPISVGDRVIITGVEDGLKSAVGRVGTVRRVGMGKNRTLIQFDEKFSPKLHGGRNDNPGPTLCCWFYSRRNFELFVDPALDISIESLL